VLVPLSWLRDFAPFDARYDTDPGALGEVFDDLGMVVEGIQRVGEGFAGVTVAKVLDVRPHPGADRVRLTAVDVGDGVPRQVVCGAPNVAAGQTVALATIGTVLPDGMEIARRKVRGEWSEGMICSAVELGLGDDGDGILVLDDELAAGTAFAEAMGIVVDIIYDLAIEANRPDALCIAGVARDAAARLGLPFAIADPPAVTSVAGRANQLEGGVILEAPELCPRFTATVFSGVVVGPSPKAVAHRLTLAGMRPISNVVDASNYVMLELGQPTHPYDLDILPGRGLLIRRAVAGETLTTLDGTERRLDDGEDCMICDATGTAVGIGGIMGGASSEISAATTTVILEAAYFTPMAIARTAKRIGLRTEASARFERGCDPDGIDRAVGRFAALLGLSEQASGTVDVDRRLPPPPPIPVRIERVNAVLGTSLTGDQIADYLVPIGFQPRPSGGDTLEVVPPSFRPDAIGEIDVVEEVARHHGYSAIATSRLKSPYVGQLSPYQQARRHLREVLVGLGISEAVCSPLVGPDDHERVGLTDPVIEAVEPLAREESVLRTSLRPGLLGALAFNASHRLHDVRLFEIGQVFTVPQGRRGPLPDEREMLGIALGGGQGAVAARQVLDVILAEFGHTGARLDAATAGGLHPTRTARLMLNHGFLGYVGEIDPEVAEATGLDGRIGWIELALVELLPTRREYPQARPVSRLPSSDIDLAFVVDDTVPAGAVEATLRQAVGALLVDLRLFDVFRDPRLGDGRRSLAFALRLQALDHTLTDAEVSSVRTRCIKAANAEHGANLR